MRRSPYVGVFMGQSMPFAAVKSSTFAGVITSITITFGMVLPMAGHSLTVAFAPFREPGHGGLAISYHIAMNREH
jgi:hypothetical protein